jgi:catalase
MPAVLFDAVVLPDGAAAIAALAQDGHAIEFLRDQHRHCKTILALGAGEDLLEIAGLRPGDGDSGVLRSGSEDDGHALKTFMAAIAKYRHFEHDADPPVV